MEKHIFNRIKEYIGLTYKEKELVSWEVYLTDNEDVVQMWVTTRGTEETFKLNVDTWETWRKS